MELNRTCLSVGLGVTSDSAPTLLVEELSEPSSSSRGSNLLL